MSGSLPQVGETITSAFDCVGILPTELQTAVENLPPNSVNHVGWVSTANAGLILDDEYMSYKQWLGYERLDFHTYQVCRAVAGYILTDAREQFKAPTPLGVALEVSNVLQPADSSPEPNYEQELHVDLPPQNDPKTLLYLAAATRGPRLVEGRYLFQGDQFKYENEPQIQAIGHRNAEDWEVVRGHMASSLHGRPRFEEPVQRPFIRAMVERRVLQKLARNPDSSSRQA